MFHPHATIEPSPFKPILWNTPAVCGVRSLRTNIESGTTNGGRSNPITDQTNYSHCDTLNALMLNWAIIIRSFCGSVAHGSPSTTASEFAAPLAVFISLGRTEPSGGCWSPHINAIFCNMGSTRRALEDCGGREVARLHWILSTRHLTRYGKRVVSLTT